MTDQLRITPPFPDRVRESMRAHLEEEDATDQLGLLVYAWSDTWREAWSMAQRSTDVAEIRSKQGHEWKRALYECALERVRDA